MTTQTDEALMQSYTCGNTTAFQELYQRHEGGLYRFIRRTLGGRASAMADEVFQDTWMNIIHARDRFDAQRSQHAWKSWAYTIAFRVAMDALRKSGKEVALPHETETGADEMDDWIQHILPQRPSSEDEVFWRAAGTQLLECLQALPAAQRGVFLLYHEDGLALDSISQRLNLPFEAIKSRMRYALKKLRLCMHPYLLEWSDT